MQQLIRMYHISQLFFKHKEDWWAEFSPHLYSERKTFLSLPKSQRFSSDSLQRGHFHLIIWSAVLRLFLVGPFSAMLPWKVCTYLDRTNSQTSIQLFLVLSYSNIYIAGHMRILIANVSFKPSRISVHFYNACQNVSASYVWMPKCQCSLFSDR